jgi:hypothetical protein
MRQSDNVLALRATAPNANGSALARHEANPWYPARITQRFSDGSFEIQWKDTGRRAFKRADEIRPARS